MKVYSVNDREFREYGRVIDGCSFDELLEELDRTTPMPADDVIYVPQDQNLEAKEEAFHFLRDNCYGGMPIQIGYCNGSNTKLNCLEFHRDSEIDIPSSQDVILLLAKQSEITDGKLSSSCVKAFLVPAGTAVEIYATTLHYAPCCTKGADGFRVIIVLPLGTNTELPDFEIKNEQDAWMTARNKWLLAHEDSKEAAQGAHIGLVGENLDVAEETC